VLTIEDSFLHSDDHFESRLLSNGPYRFSIKWGTRTCVCGGFLKCHVRLWSRSLYPVFESSGTNVQKNGVQGSTPQPTHIHNTHTHVDRRKPPLRGGFHDCQVWLWSGFPYPVCGSSNTMDHLILMFKDMGYKHPLCSQTLLFWRPPPQERILAIKVDACVLCVCVCSNKRSFGHT